MVIAIDSGFAPACNSLERPVALPPNHHSRTPAPSAGPAHTHSTRQHPDLAAHPFVSPEDQVTILAAVNEAGVVELGDLIAALPHHPRPITAILALIEAGLLAVDFRASFDSPVRIWRP
ncbi:hypothetical protein [Microvirga tunisiensis]|uniref:DprA winged helix domain-containing protein n=1 Tax=Microvirga tunisiensis TaxID=2108360 RepID=A0A5N7MKE6_9HYPH|nr:hypothetical protein [Microvirga tunisiensis]MPR09317.1 hypothetical protein [Microvirga tunisiensis]MPR27525.1 hypothetical protein [Microvirga tunisiensis]